MQRHSSQGWRHDARTAAIPPARRDDPMGGLPMRLRPFGQADVTRDEPAPEKIARMQRMLGGAFNGAWSAWVRKAARKQGGSW
eukprot:8417596-Pyramimonas_sp.AAC.1